MAKRPHGDPRGGGSHNHKSHKTHHGQDAPSRPSKPNGHSDKLSLLDRKHPPTASYSPIPPYKASSTVPFNPARSSLPPLPPVSPELSDAPFTHSSMVNVKHGASNGLNYERLEFLGDAYIEIMATRIIYARFPTYMTGQLANLRERLVRNSTLATFARRYGFGARLRMDKESRGGFDVWQATQGHGKDGSKNSTTWEKVMADVFEAYVAAAVLSDDENGYAAVEAWLTSLWLEMLLETDEDAALEIVQNRKDELTRKIGAKDVKIEYVEEKPVESTQDKSRKMFHVAVQMTGWGFDKKRLGGGAGISKKEAGMRAAADALDNNTTFIEELAEVKRVFDEERRARMEKAKAEENAAD